MDTRYLKENSLGDGKCRFSVESVSRNTMVITLSAPVHRDTSVVGGGEWDELDTDWAVGTAPVGDLDTGEGDHELRWP